MRYFTKYSDEIPFLFRSQAASTPAERGTNGSWRKPPEALPPCVVFALKAKGTPSIASPSSPVLLTKGLATEDKPASLQTCYRNRRFQPI